MFGDDKHHNQHAHHSDAVHVHDRQSMDQYTFESKEKDAYSSHVGPAGRAEDGNEVDAVWGELDGKGPNYRGLGWVRTIVVMIKIQIGLGILGMVSCSFGSTG